MGIQIYQESYTEQDYCKYQVRIREQLEVLSDMVNTSGFGGDSYSFGAELEVYVTDCQGIVKPINRELLLQVGDPRISLELNKFNLEYNLSPVATEGRPFQTLQNEINEIQDLVDQDAQILDAQIVPIGILPTLKRDDIKKDTMTNLSRFRALSNGLKHLRGEAFNVEINGEDPCSFNCHDITLEGANTSFQFHLKTPLEHFTNTWNALQLVTPLVLALSGNSPILFGHRLWQETRIALFKQSVDNRRRDMQNWRKPARVNFGQGWLRKGPWELFAENVALFEPVLPISSPQDSAETFKLGDVPDLDELRLHQSTIWTWNRAVFDPEADGHFRIECRSLPAGPTSVDMISNIALLSGLALGLRDEMPNLVPAFPFQLAEYNFYRAAQDGLNAKLVWPDTKSVSPVEVTVIQKLNDLLPVAEKGLKLLGVDSDDISLHLGNIQNRLDKNRTGSIWQLETLAHYQQFNDLETSLEKMQVDYIREMRSGRSVAFWEQH